MIKFKFFNAFTIALMLLQAVVPIPALAMAGSDLPDYAPGSVVTFSGDNSNEAGYLPAETVQVDVSGLALTCDTTADDSGAWSCQVTLPSDAADGSYDWTATGQTSGASESGSFTITAPPPTATEEPTAEPTAEPTSVPTVEPTSEPTTEPTVDPTDVPTQEPTQQPTAEPPAMEPPAPAPAPFIQSDKDDYAPAELVTLISGNWQPGEWVEIYVNDNIGQTWSIRTNRQADANGGFVYQFNLPSWFVATYEVIATGQVSGVTTTNFTDAAIILSPISGPVGTTVAITSNAGNGGAFAGHTAIIIKFDGSTLTTSPSPCVTNNGGNISSPGCTFVIPSASVGAHSVSATDGTKTATAPFTVTASNTAPVLAAIGNNTVNEGSLLTFTATATDSDTPAQTLTFNLVGAPAGASINNSTGAFSWTPTEAQGPGNYPFTVKVCDNGTPSLCDEEAISVQVNEVNVAPVLGAIGNKTVNEGSLLNFTASATDADLPVQTLTFSLTGAPLGASINSSTGAFSWTPTETQGGSSYTFDVCVSDGALSDCETIEVSVTEVNAAPVLGMIGNQTVNEGSTLSFTASATDADIPAQTLAFGLTSAPLGASIDSSTGAFSWTPTETQGPGSYMFDVCVSDGALSDCETITVTVNEVNAAPVLGTIGDKNVDEGDLLTFTATATDSDIPAQTLTFSLDGAPAGASIDGNTGEFSWTPTEAQGPDVYTFDICVGDGSMEDCETIEVTVAEINVAPVLDAIGDQTVDEGDELTFTATAIDADLPANTLTFSLDGAPSGAAIDGSTGEFSWTPTEAQGPDVYTFDVCVSDGALRDCEEITVTVGEVNVAPVLDPIGAQNVNEGSLLSFTATASDADVPAQTLSFSLEGEPGGASINPSTGVFNWTPSETQGPGSYTFDVCVSDGLLEDCEEITVTIAEVNVAPVLDSIDDQSVDEETELTFTATASDADFPLQALSFSLDGAPAGASINGSTGKFSWTPTEAQGPDSYTFDVCVSDAALSDCEEITVTVGEVNVVPVLDHVGNQAVDEGDELTFIATASDADVPSQALFFSLDGAPTGASIDDNTGEFSWTPAEAQGPDSYTFDVCVSDGSLKDCEEIIVTVAEVNVAPVLGTIGNQSVNEGSLLSFTATATDADLPVNTLSFSLDGAPAGASIDGSTGVFSWTPADNGVLAFTVKVCDDGLPELCDQEEITVTVNNVAPAVDAGNDDTIDEGSTFSGSGSFIDPGADTWTATVDYGDGSSVQPLGLSGTTFSLSHTYANDGSYTVEVCVMDDEGDSGCDELVVTVDNVVPLVNAGADDTIDEGNTFVGEGSFTDPGADSWTATVDYGDGSGEQSLVLNPDKTFSLSHTYADDGLHTVEVCVTDDDNTRCDTLIVTVSNVAPTLVISGNANVSEASLFILVLSSNDPGADTIIEWTIDWGDGTVETVTGDPSSATHIYADGPNDYSIQATATDEDGSWDANSLPLHVDNVAPTITISGNPNVDEGSLYTLNLSSSDPGADTITEWTIDWGDGTIDTVTGDPSSVTHVYVDGTNDYTIMATASDEDGTFNANSQDVHVTNVAPAVDAGANDTIDEGNTFNGSGSFTDPGDDTWTATVDYGDGSGVQTLSLNLDKTFGLSHAHADNGSYTVTVCVTDDDDDTGCDTLIVTVNNVEPTIEISGEADVDEGSLYSLTLGEVTDPGDDTVSSYIVHWGDGSTDTYSSNGAKTHTYADGSNNYNIIIDLVDEDNTFEDQADAFTVTVNNIEPTIVISGASDVNEGSSYTLDLGEVTDPGDDTVSSYIVHWGDGNSNTYSANGVKTHTYADGANTYNITVDLVDEDGTFLDQANAFSVTVNNVEPTITINGAASVNEGSSYSLTLGAVIDPGADTVSSYIVHWGDGSSDTYTSNGVKTHTYADGLNSHSITVDLVDEDGTFLDQANAFSVTVNNVEPTITISGAASINEGSSYSLDLGAVTDPGTDTVTSYVVHWGDGSSDTYTSNGVKTHTYADGPNAYNITVDLSDEDGTFLDQANVLSVTVNNVKPTPTITSITGNSGAACVAGKTVTLGFSWTDPAGANDTYGYVVDWGDGSPHTIGNNATSPVSGLTHNYLAGGPYTISVSVNDEDSGSPNLAATSTSFSFLYNTSGILQPINLTGPRSSFKIGSTIPVKLQVTDCNGLSVGGLTLTVHLAQVDPTASSVNELISTSAADSGTTMRYVGAPENQYMFNLSTKRSQFNAGQDLTTGTYRIWITGAGIAQVEAYLDVRK